MAKRKAIPKSLRFEVFKRDSFTCQYCGRSAPDVLLEVDHIIPVSKGGTDDLLNLVTSCRDCNRGKSAKLLSDSSAIKKQKAQLDELNEKREQMEMMIEWKKMLMEMIEEQASSIEDYIYAISLYYLTDSGKSYIKRLIGKYGYSEVYTATEISFGKYYKDDSRSIDIAINKIGGVCYNRQKQRCENGNQKDR